MVEFRKQPRAEMPAQEKVRVSQELEQEKEKRQKDFERGMDRFKQGGYGELWRIRSVSDLSPDDDVFAAVKGDREKREVQALREFVRKFPKEALLHREEFPEFFQSAIEREALAELVVQDERSAEEFYREHVDVSGWTQEHTPEENLDTAVEWMMRDAAIRVLEVDPERAIEHYRRYVVRAGESEKDASQRALVRSMMWGAVNILERNPQAGLRAFEVINHLEGADVEEVAREAKRTFTKKASEVFLTINPDVAERMHELFVHRAFTNPSFSEGTKSVFAERLNIYRLLQQAKEGDLEGAWGAFRQLGSSENSKVRQDKGAFKFHFKKEVQERFRLAWREDDREFDFESEAEGVEYVRAKAVYRELSDDMPGFEGVSKGLQSQLQFEVGERFKNRYTPGQIKGTVPEIRKGKDELKAQVVGEVFAGAEELIIIAPSKKIPTNPEVMLNMTRGLLANRDRRQQTLQLVELDALPGDAEFRTSEEYHELRKVLFDAQSILLETEISGGALNMNNVFLKNIDAFGDLVEGLDPKRKEQAITRGISKVPEKMVGAVEGGLRLTSGDLEKLLAQMANNGSRIREFLGDKHRGFYDVVEMSQEEVLRQLIQKKPFKVHEVCLNKKEEDKDFELPGGLRGDLMDAMVAMNPVRMLANIEAYPKEGHVFDHVAVQRAYFWLLDPEQDHPEFLSDIENYTEVKPDWKVIAGIMQEQGIHLLVVEQLIRDYPELAEHIPWAPTLKKLEKLQAHTANAAHDPWKTDLGPLVHGLVEGGLLSYDAPEDGELLLKFVEEYGMINAPRLADIVIRIERHGGASELRGVQRDSVVEALMEITPQITQKRAIKALESVPERDLSWSWAKEILEKVAPIDPETGKRTLQVYVYKQGEQRFIRQLYQEGRIDRLTAPLLLSELREVRSAAVSDFLRDEVPSVLKTKLGSEIFAAAVGSGQWARPGEVREVIDTWEQVVTETPELAKLPEGYQEEEIVVGVRERSTKGKQEKQKEQVRRVLAGKPLEVERQAYFEVFDPYPPYQPDKTLSAFIGELVATTKERLRELEERVGSLHGKAQEGLKKRVAQMREQVMGYEEFDRVSSQKSVVKTNHAALMEQWVQLGGKGPLYERVIQRLSAVHNTILQPPGGPEYEEWFHDGKKDGEELGALEQVGLAAEFIEQVLTEHYLHPDQDPKHTNHRPFSDELIRVLKKVWRVEKGVEKNPFVAAKKKIAEINGPGEVSKKTMSVAMVPGEGLPKIMSGDTGDACYTSKRDTLAKGGYPDLHAFTYVLGRDTAQERFAGSVLFCEGQLADGKTSALLVRANNPRENLIQSVDNESFVLQSLEKAIETAQRRGIEQVLVPIDDASQSSSNRQGVSSVYQKFFGKHKRQELRATPEMQFNGYDNWNASGPFGCVVIWTKEQGKINWPE